MKNRSLVPLMGATTVHDLCQVGLLLRRQTSRLRIGHSMVVVKEPMLPERANLSCLTKSVR
jgi:hypothetical protein